jgi:peroxiredoxin
MPKRLFGVLAVVVVSLNIVAWSIILIRSNGNQERKSLYYQSEQSISQISPVTIKLKDDTFFELSSLDAELNVLIFFSFEDCASCLFEADYWGKAARMFESPEVKFWGIVEEDLPDHIANFRNEYKLSFPIISDYNGKIRMYFKRTSSFKKLNFHITPIKVFISNNKIVQVDGPRKKPIDQAMFPEVVSEVLKRIRNK